MIEAITIHEGQEVGRHVLRVGDLVHLVNLVKRGGTVTSESIIYRVLNESTMLGNFRVADADGQNLITGQFALRRHEIDHLNITSIATGNGRVVAQTQYRFTSTDSK